MTASVQQQGPPTDEHRSSRFAARHSDEQLLGLVATIAEAARPDAPLLVTQAAYDTARRLPEFTALAAPTAAATARRLGLPWRELLVFAFDPGRNLQRSQAARNATEDREITLDDAAVGLRIVAKRLGTTNLNPGRYEAERLAMVETEQRKWLHGVPDRLPLPTINQITAQVGFQAALDAAGLEHDPGVGRPKGEPILAMMETFLQEEGFITSLKVLQAWVKARGISMERITGRHYSDLIIQLGDQRASRGLWTPTAATPRAEREPDLSTPEGMTARPDWKRWTYETCLDGLTTATRELPAGKRRLTQALLRQIAKGRSDIPAPSVVGRIAVDRGTTFTAMRDEAARRR